MPQPQPVSLFNVEPLYDRLAAGELILSPNQRLASRISNAYSIASKDRGHSVVVAPQVYAIEQLLDKYWRQLLGQAYPPLLSCYLLSASQEALVWEQLVASSEAGGGLLKPAAAAQQAAAAYQQLLLWGQSISAEVLRAELQADDDSRVLLEWMDAFEDYCQRNSCMPMVARAELVAVAFERGLLPVLETIILVGFEDIAPLYRRLLSCMVAGSSPAIEEYHPVVDAADAHRVELASEQEELYAAACWAKQLLRDRPERRIAIVIPDLARRRQSVVQQIEEVLAPAYMHPDSVRSNVPFTISAAYPLSGAAVISAALKVLELLIAPQDRDVLVNICQSPFYGVFSGQPEPDAATAFPAALIQRLMAERSQCVSFSRLRQLAAAVSEQCSGDVDQVVASPEEGRDFSALLQELMTVSRRENIQRRRPVSEWVQVFNRLLQAVHWPGPRNPDSIEYQQLLHWQQLLLEFGSLQRVVADVSFVRAVSLLRGLLGQTQFQPKSPDSALQLLGTLEAAGLEFSHVWLLGMSDLQWPARPNPNPLLPFPLQQRLQMPHANAERELQYAQSLRQRFLHSCNSLIVSNSASIDQCGASVSPLFRDLPAIAVDELFPKPLESLQPLPELRRRHRESAVFEEFHAGPAPVYRAGEKLTNASGIFASQSACPFRAFSKHRLGLQALPDAQLGLSAADRGSLLHRALELLWAKLKQQQALLDMDDLQVTDLCCELADFCVTELSQRQASPPGDRFLQLETARLRRLLLEWLQLEKQRASFVVESLELRQQFRFAELEIVIRVDRIDRLGNGERVLIDYKTGRPSPAQWWGERLDDPQLPLYSSLLDCEQDPVASIAFAQVRINECVIKGVGAEDLPEKNLAWNKKAQTDSGAVDWPQLKLRWQSLLATLAQDFIDGKVSIDPKRSAQTCQYCDYKSFCRIDHRELNHITG